VKARFMDWLKAEDWGRLWAGIIFLAVFSILGAMIPSQGLTDDDDFYGPAGIQYANWLTEAVVSPSTAFTQQRIDKAFKINREHPPFAKYVIGLAHHGISKIGVLNGLDAARCGVAFFAALLCAVMLRLLWVPLGRMAAFFSVVALLSLPRFVFHSQVATLDVPVACMVFLTTAAFYWSLSSKSWAMLTGLIFGFALLTKLNAPFAVFPMIIFACISGRRHFKIVRQRRRSFSLALPPIPRSLFAMAILGPLVFLACWPWLWSDTFNRIGAYVAFHMKHYPIYLFYRGEVFTEPFAPWTMPFTLAAAVIPLPLLFLGLLGTIVAIRSLIRFWRAEKSVILAREISSKEKLLALVLLEAFFAISIVAFSNVPKYGGAKLFMPFFPLFAVLMAAGLLEMKRLLALTFFGGLSRSGNRNLNFCLALVFCSAILPGQIANAHFSGGFGLSYYSGAVGGLKGATARGFERTYYDIADKELAVWLAKNADAGSIHFAPNHKEYVRTYRWLKKDGYIPRTVRLEKKKARAQYLVLTHERRWTTYPGLYADALSWTPIYEKQIDGVPLYTVYEKK
jgi:4-amino-4-deoxy-L-arabinose transferase-like glycosyltransferase